jgi:broad-specificity NMP kinase
MFKEVFGVSDSIAIQKFSAPVKTKKIIAVAGRPGTGKTTLFREFMKDYTWVNVEPKKMLPSLYCEQLDLYVLGKYEDGETFAGTDRLGMSVQPIAQEFVSETTSNILFEGDRLTNGKFYSHLISLPNTDVSFAVLRVKEETMTQRYSDRGSNQSDTFLKGRETKISNILTNFEFMSYVTEFTNENLEDQAKIIAHIKKFLG